MYSIALLTYASKVILYVLEDPNLARKNGTISECLTLISRGHYSLSITTFSISTSFLQQVINICRKTFILDRPFNDIRICQKSLKGLCSKTFYESD
jgi:hypothetical protein